MLAKKFDVEAFAFTNYILFYFIFHFLVNIALGKTVTQGSGVFLDGKIA